MEGMLKMNTQAQATQSNSPTIAENFGVEYVPVGDYLLPNIALTENPDEKPLGKYGMMRKAFLKEHRRITYSMMLCREQLYPHCRETEELAEARLTQVMNALLEKAVLPDKAIEPMNWTAEMNTLKAQAEELVLHELIYAVI
jgi:hypothetical protein